MNTDTNPIIPLGLAPVAESLGLVAEAPAAAPVPAPVPVPVAPVEGGK